MSAKHGKRINAVALLAAACGKNDNMKKAAGKVADAVLSPKRKVNTKNVESNSQTDSQSGSSSQSSCQSGSQTALWKQHEPTNYKMISSREEREGKSSVLVYNLKDKCLYSARSSRGDTAYVVCTEKSCKAVGVIKEGTFSNGLKRRHSHINNHEQRYQSLRSYNDLKQRVIGSKEGIHSIYRQWLREQNDDYIISDHPWEKVSNTLEYWRLSKFPSCHDQETLDQLLRENQNIKKEFGKFKDLTFYQGIFNGSALFINEKIIKRIPCSTKSNWYFDSTFKILPLEFKQLFIGHVEIEETTYPAVYALMNNSKHENYASIFEWMKLMHNVYPNRIVMDNELAQMNASKEVWPEAIIQNCYFHFAQAIRKNAVDKVVNYSKSDHRTIISMFRKLPLLPLKFITAGIDEIIKLQKKWKIYNDFNKFNEYFLSTWTVRYNLKDWCVYGVANRTNNFCESHNSAIKRYVPNKPNVYTFLDKLQDMAHEAYAKLLARLKDVGKNVPARRPKSKLSEAIETFIPKLQQEKISVIECLESLVKAEEEEG